MAKLRGLSATRALALAAGLWGAGARPADLPPGLIARIQVEQAEAVRAVSRKHGDRKPSEMEGAERRQVIAETARAQEAILAKHGVSAKDYARASATLTKAQLREKDAEVERLQAEARAKAGSVAP